MLRFHIYLYTGLLIAGSSSITTYSTSLTLDYYSQVFRSFKARTAVSFGIKTVQRVSSDKKQKKQNSLMNQGANIAIPGLNKKTNNKNYGEIGLGSVTNVANFSRNPSS